jgi:hypothetical protein
MILETVVVKIMVLWVISHSVMLIHLTALPEYLVEQEIIMMNDVQYVTHV